MEKGTASAIAIVVNGEPRDADSGATVEAFLRAHGLEPDLVVVEKNGAILARGELATEPLESGDRLEVVHFVGGG